MKIYSLGNKAKIGMYVVAANEEEARDIGMRFGHARKRENLRVLDITLKMLANDQHPQTALSLAKIIEQNATGQLVLVGTAHRMSAIAQHLLAGTRPVHTPPTWTLLGSPASI